MQILLALFLSLILMVSCKEITTTTTDISENAQQIGDVMASIDETGNSSGTLVVNYQLQGVQKTFARYSPEDSNMSDLFARVIFPKAEAVSCLGYGYSSCSSGVITRSFDGCTIGSATFSGGVSFTWSNTTNCALDVLSEHVSRSPNFTVTGRRNATLTVTKSGSIGQRITVTNVAGTSSVFSFSNDGIRRVFTRSGDTLFDQTTSTSGTLTITGTSRANRVLTSTGGATLRVVNNLSSVVCNYTPNNVTWSSTTCNCPVAGSWSGTCSNGNTATLNITGCGTATYTEGGESDTVTFDRCGTN